MLVLTRKIGKSIVMNPGTPDEIVVTVVNIQGDQVRIGVEAPRSVVVHRKEVAEAIERGEERGKGHSNG